MGTSRGWLGNTAVTQLVDEWDVSHISEGKLPHTKQLQIALNNFQITTQHFLFLVTPKGIHFEGRILILCGVFIHAHFEKRGKQRKKI